MSCDELRPTSPFLVRLTCLAPWPRARTTRDCQLDRCLTVEVMAYLLLAKANLVSISMSSLPPLMYIPEATLAPGMLGAVAVDMWGPTRPVMRVWVSQSVGA